jgi:hypothetical protein
MRKEIQFAIDETQGSYAPVVVYFDDSNNEFDRRSATTESILNEITESDLIEFSSLAKQSLLDDLDNIYNTDYNVFVQNVESIFRKHRINYQSFSLIKRHLIPEDNNG